MPAERLSMRQIRDLLRLCFAAKLPQRAVARSLGLSQGAVSRYLSRARAAGVSWPLPEDLDDARLEALLFPPPSATPADQRAMPDWAWVAPRAALPRCNTGPAVGGIPGRRCRGVQLFLVLRSLPGLDRPAEADDAPGPRRRREAVRRF